MKITRKARSSDDRGAETSGGRTRKGPLPKLVQALLEDYAVGPPHARAKTLSKMGELLSQGAQHVGTTWIEELEWLVSCVRRPARELSKNLNNPDSELAYQVAWFSRDAEGAGLESPRRDWIFSGLRYIRDQITSLVDTGSCQFHITNATFVLMRPYHGYTGPSNRLISWHRSEEPLSKFLLSAHRILELEGVRLTRCALADCHQIFVKKKRAMFCSKRCSQREQSRRWRERHPGLAAERQHKYYENSKLRGIAKTNNRKDVKVKIGRRARTREAPR